MEEFFQAAPQSHRYSASIYGGKPISETMSGVHGTGANAGVSWPNYITQPRGILGGRVEYQPESLPYLALALDAWRNKSDIPIQKDMGRTFTQELLNLSPMAKLHYPMKGMDPYIAGGPVFSRTEQCDATGCSAPSMDMGVQGEIGSDFNLTDNAALSLALKYHDANLRPDDEQGAINGRHRNLSGIAGFKYRW